MRAALLLLFSLALAGEAYGDTCTDGTNCFCDDVTDARKLLCEDFEPATYHDARGTGTAGTTGPSGCVVGGDSTTINCYGDTGTLKGPFYDHTTSAINGCGEDSLWTANWGSPDGQCAWNNGDTCGPGPSPVTCGGSPCFAAVYKGSDDFNGNTRACFQIVSDLEDEWAQEIGTETPPERPDGTTGGYGNQTLAFRSRDGNGGAIVGEKTFGAAPAEVGITMLLAYSHNFEASNALSNSWKHLETGPSRNAPFVFYSSSHSSTEAPFAGLYWGTGQAACTTALTAATVNTGSLTCPVSGNLLWSGGSAYAQGTDWPDMYKWTCARGHYRQIGTGNAGCTASGNPWACCTDSGTGTCGMAVTITADFGSGDQTILDFSGYDSRSAVLTDGANIWASIVLNNYSNVGNDGLLDVAVVRRYEDNLYIRGGSTAQCAGGACEPITCNEAQFYESEAAGGPTITITGATASDLTPTTGETFSLEVTYTSSDTTGTITCEVDLENDGGYEDGSDTGASPQTITGLSYGSAGIKTIGVRCEDESTASDTETESVTVTAPSSNPMCCG